MKTSEIIGKEVLDFDALKAGKVADIDIDLANGAVNHFIIKAGLTKKYVISLADINKIGDKVTLRIKAEDLCRFSS
ncbi:MAG: PRC-barrel domain-containing protein [Dehalococcoidales bacterium]|nr:PRC-barrel domain-containing protein [Dehalococcoidales bacterium]